MGIFSRFKDIVNSNINTLLDKAEDPEKMVRMMISEMEDTLIEMKSNYMNTVEKLQKNRQIIDEMTRAEERWVERAKLAISNQRDDMAKEALSEKHSLGREKEQLKKVCAELENSIETAKLEIAQITQKLQEVKERYRVIKKSDSFESGTSTRSRGNRFDSIDEILKRMDEENPRNKTEWKFRDLEEQTAVEAELKELKEQQNRN